MDTNFYYKIDLPFSKQKVYFKELTTQNQLDIEKLNLFYPAVPDYYWDYHENFLKVIKSCIENFDDFLKCDILDYLLFCLKLRIISINNTIELQIKNEDPEVEITKISLDLQTIIQNILMAGSDSLVVKEIYQEDKNLKIEIGWPSIQSVKSFYNLYFSNIQFEEKILEIIPEFITKVHIRDEVIQFQKLSHDEKEKVLFLFPASIKNQIQEAVLANINKLASYSIFNIKQLENQKFNFFNLIFIELIKLIFSQNPKRIYEEIYILSNHHLDSNYILNMAPSERKIYVSFIEAQRKSQSPPNAAEDASSFVPPSEQKTRSVEDLAVEFGDVPPN
jgi:hypothetical protein